MLLNSLLNPNRSLTWTLFHIILAVACTITPFALIGWFYLIFITSIGRAVVLLQRGKYDLYIALLFYLVSFEMLGRMAKAYPYIPTEIGKYFLIFFCSLGIIINGIRNSQGIVMGLLLLPALLYDVSEQRVFTDIVFNAFGPLGLALGIAFLFKTRISQHQFNQVLHLMWLACISALFFTFIKTPDLDSIDFGLKSEFATTAETSSNQVSTILGLGMFLSFYAVIKRLKFSGFLLGDLAILMLFSFQGLLSFSRGGMLIAASAMLIFFIFGNETKSIKNRGKIITTGILAVLSLYVIAQLANQITDGNLFLRYSGETAGTLLGTKEKTADVIVSGRLTIFNEDLEIWSEHPLWGTGIGSSRYLRAKSYKVVPHVELSRLLAEHGILGLLYFALLIWILWRIYQSYSHYLNKGFFLALVILGVLTTFHAAMRTFVTPTLLVISVLNVVPNNKPSKNQP